MPRLAGVKNRVKVDFSLSPWYNEKIKDLRDGTGFESDQAFMKWLLQNTVQVLCGEREPSNQKLSDLRVRMEEALGMIEASANE
tara:strand:+ start:841 stop:1092 length:252 start_codon:yes stop_codon:yes gene_type:complete